MDDKERKAEDRLISAIEKLRFKAYHMNTDIDGFCDILAFGPKNSSFLCEMKEGRLDRKLRNVYETSQPRFMDSLMRIGYENVSTCVYFNGVFYLYCIENVVKTTFSSPDRTFLDLIPSCIGTADEVAAFLVETSL